MAVWTKVQSGGPTDRYCHPQCHTMKTSINCTNRNYVYWSIECLKTWTSMGYKVKTDKHNIITYHPFSKICFAAAITRCVWFITNWSEHESDETVYHKYHFTWFHPNWTTLMGNSAATLEADTINSIINVTLNDGIYNARKYLNRLADTVVDHWRECW